MRPLLMGVLWTVEYSIAVLSLVPGNAGWLPMIRQDEYVKSKLRYEQLLGVSQSIMNCFYYKICVSGHTLITVS